MQNIKTDYYLSEKLLLNQTGMYILLAGILSQIGQVLIFREIMSVSHGTEFIFGIILGAGFFWTSTGTVIGGLITHRKNFNTKRTTNILLKLSFLSGIILSIEIIAIRNGN